jgi:hypothetical protein
LQDDGDTIVVNSFSESFLGGFLVSESIFGGGTAGSIWGIPELIELNDSNGNRYRELDNPLARDNFNTTEIIDPPTPEIDTDGNGILDINEGPVPNFDLQKQLGNGIPIRLASTQLTELQIAGREIVTPSGQTVVIPSSATAASLNGTSPSEFQCELCRR